MNALLHDVRYGLRVLLKTPAFSLVAVISLALGIGLNTAIFSIVNTLLIRSVPVVSQQNRLVWLRAPISYPDYQDYRNQANSFDGMAAISGTQDFSIAAGSEPELVKGEYVTANYFDVLGVGASLGRVFVEEDTRTQTPVVILSEHLWRTRFASDANIVGRQISLNGFGFTVVGVMPPNFIGTEVGLNRELWLPFSEYALLNPPGVTADTRSNPLDIRNAHWLAVFARLKPDVSRESAETELTEIARRVAENYRGHVDAETLRSVRLLRMSGGMDPRDQEEVFPIAGIALGVVALVLLIACANIASLLLARAAIRRRETAIRQALGATRPRLVRQWLTESVLLGIAGGAIGLILAVWAIQVLVSYLQSTPLAALEFGLDYRVLAFTLVVSVVTGIIFGLAPALQASRLNLVLALKSDDGFKLSGGHRSYLRNAFVTIQLILSVVLLVGSGLFIRALQRASSIDPGFTVERGLQAPINLGLLRYDKTEGQAFYRELLARIQTQPGIEHATLVRFPQMGSAFAQFQIFKEGSERASEGMSAGFNVVGPNFFTTMGTPLLRGREFTEADREGAPGTVVVNATLAARLWPNEDALGKRVSVNGPDGPFLEVVGVARDSKYRTLGETPRPNVYLPLQQSYDPKMTLVIRTAGEPQAVTPVVREQIRALNANLPIADVQTMRQQIELTLLPSRIAAWTLGGFGLLALLLAGIGIYGVVSYGAAQRTREIGVRMALGASEKDVLGLVLWDGLIVIGAGLAIGLLLAAAATRVIGAFLYGVGATDPLTFVAVPLLLGAVAVVASYIPARRAVKVDPLVALRYE